MQQQVWSGDTFVDFERGLNYCIAQIRTALGDSASEPRFIETLPRRGYRFVACVQNGAVQDSLPDVQVAQAQSRSQPWQRSWSATVSVTGLILALGSRWPGRS